ncbi:hypothetical protein J31TS6_11410 [Brevibacillus reuszeri]|nr:hypothetical protein J31TS6_11410 [Brevibacillus reuszeri]
MFINKSHELDFDNSDRYAPIVLDGEDCGTISFEAGERQSRAPLKVGAFIFFSLSAQNKNKSSCLS